MLAKLKAKYFLNVANLLAKQGRFDDALQRLNQVLQFDKNFVDAYLLQGNCYRELEDSAKAINSFQTLLDIDPQHALGKAKLSLVYLQLGEFEKGLPLYELRRNVFPENYPSFNYPEWSNEDLNNKSLLVYTEQGFGDTIHFVRYLDEVMRKYPHCRIILSCQTPLVRLLKTKTVASKIIADSEPFPHCDYHVPLLSIPWKLQTQLQSILNHIPYIEAPQELVTKWKQRIGGNKSLKVGFGWTGLANHPENRKRSCPFDFYKAFFEGLDADYICIHKDVEFTEGEQQLADDYHLQFFEDELTDFADTAALIANLDFVITTDTGVAHLAAAMGTRTELLLAFSADWRWMFKRTDSPWYPTLTLHRQARAQEWQPVIDQVMNSVGAAINSSK